jgi:hypothetical protein
MNPMKEFVENSDSHVDTHFDEFVNEHDKTYDSEHEKEEKKNVFRFLRPILNFATRGKFE